MPYLNKVYLNNLHLRYHEMLRACTRFLSEIKSSSTTRPSTASFTFEHSMDSTGSTNSNSFHDYNASAEIPERLQKLANESVLPFLYDKMKLYPAFDPWNTTSETNNASIDFMSSMCTNLTFQGKITAFAQKYLD